MVLQIDTFRRSWRCFREAGINQSAQPLTCSAITGINAGRKRGGRMKTWKERAGIAALIFCAVAAVYCALAETESDMKDSQRFNVHTTTADKWSAS